MTETILQALTWSENGWTGPYERKDGAKATGSYVTDGGWGAEDWMFARTPDQLVKGKIYSYAQGNPNPKRVKAAKGVFNLVFFSQRPDGDVVLIGAYLSARYVSEDEIPARWQEMKDAGVLSVRSKQLKAAFEHAEDGAAAVAALKAEKPVRWVVGKKNVILFPTTPAFREPGLHPNDPYFFHKLEPAVQEFIGGLMEGKIPQLPDPELDAAGFDPEVGTETEAKEGRKLKRSHLYRERNSALAKLCRKLNLSPGSPHFHTCEACDASLVAELGPHAIRGFDVHHQVPLAKAGNSGVVNKVEDLCVLCVRCHRLSHASKMFTVKELRSFHAKMKASP